MTIRSCLEKLAAETPDVAAVKFFDSDKEWHVRTWSEFLAGVVCAADAYGPRFG